MFEDKDPFGFNEPEPEPEDDGYDKGPIKDRNAYLGAVHDHVKDGRCNEPLDGELFCWAFTMDNGKCLHHGGKKLPNIQEDVFGKVFSASERSRHMPKRLFKRFVALAEDGRAFDFQEDILTLDTRITELFDALRTGGGIARMWKSLRKRARSYNIAVNSQQYSRKKQVLKEVFEIIEEGAHDVDTWESILTMLEQRRKIVDSERKRMESAQQMMSTQQTMVLMHQILAIIQENVKDPDALKGISAGLTDLIGAPNGAKA